MENQFLDSEMLNRDGKSLSALLANGYQTHSVDYIKKGFALFKQDIGPYIGFLLIVGLAEAIISMIPFLKGLAGPIVAPLMAGGYVVAKMIDRNEPHEFSNFFDGTKKYQNLFVVALIPTLIVALLTLATGGFDYFRWSYLGMRNIYPAGPFGIPTIPGFAARGRIAGLIGAVIFILFMLGHFLVLFEDFKPVRALEISAKIVSKRFFNWLGFLLLLGLFNLAGAICLFVGLLVTIPSTICALYAAYEDVIGLNLRD
jgi:hypothetical protein